MFKSVLLCAALVMLAVTCLSAQTFKLGVRAGYSTNRVVHGFTYPRPTLEYYIVHPLNGVLVGLEGKMTFGSRFSLLGSAQYATRGYSFAKSRTNKRMQLHYLDLPLAVDFRLWQGLSLQGGLQAGYLLAAKHYSENPTLDLTKSGVFNRFDVAWLAGLEYSFLKSFFLNARYVHGLTDVETLEFTDQDGNPAGPDKASSRSFQFSAGYRWSF